MVLRQVACRTSTRGYEFKSRAIRAVSNSTGWFCKLRGGRQAIPCVDPVLANPSGSHGTVGASGRGCTTSARRRTGGGGTRSTSTATARTGTSLTPSCWRRRCSAWRSPVREGQVATPKRDFHMSHSARHCFLLASTSSATTANATLPCWTRKALLCGYPIASIRAQTLCES